MLKNLIQGKRKQEQESKSLSFEEVTKLMFLLVPYAKTTQALITEYKDNKSDALLFLDVAKSLITQLSGDELAEAVGILFGISTDEARKMPIQDVSLKLPQIIFDNKLVEIYLLFNMLGLFK